jgi:phosphohistidine phosphatase SixA
MAAQAEEVALGEALRQGGHVIFLRHGQEAGQDQNPLDLEDCATQQFLTEEGHAQARAIGEAFRTLEIPVGQVLSSPICRAYDTAVGAFGDAEALDVLSLPATIDPTTRDMQPGFLAALLATPPPAGTNTVVVSQSNLLMGVAGVGVERGEAAIFAGDGAGGFTLVRHVAWDAWPDLDASN